MKMKDAAGLNDLHRQVPAPWPFPPPTGLVPWTPQQIAQHQLQQLANTPAAPF
jgi:hypothetical protein